MLVDHFTRLAAADIDGRRADAEEYLMDLMDLVDLVQMETDQEALVELCQSENVPLPQPHAHQMPHVQDAEFRHALAAAAAAGAALAQAAASTSGRSVSPTQLAINVGADISTQPASVSGVCSQWGERSEEEGTPVQTRPPGALLYTKLQRRMQQRDSDDELRARIEQLENELRLAQQHNTEPKQQGGRSRNCSRNSSSSTSRSPDPDEESPPSEGTPPPMSNLDVLLAMPLFEWSDDSNHGQEDHTVALAQLAAEADQFVLARGDTVITEGEPGTECMFVVARGTLQATRSGVGVVASYGEMGYFGEHALLVRVADEVLKPRGASVVTTSETALVLRVWKEHLATICPGVLSRLQDELRFKICCRGPAGQLTGCLFDLVDRDASGFLDAAEGRTYLSLMGCDPADLEYYWSDLRRCADTDGDGRVSKTEFNKYLLSDMELDDDGRFMDLEHERKLRRQIVRMGDAGMLCSKLFDCLDQDGSGYLEHSEVRAYLEMSGCAEHEIEYYLKDLLRVADKNGDGVVEKVEFLDYVLGDERLDNVGSFVDPSARADLVHRLQQNGSAAQLIGALFDVVDQDGSGAQEDESKLFLGLQGCNEAELDYYWADLKRCVDHDANGSISKSEFIEYRHAATNKLLYD